MSPLTGTIITMTNPVSSFTSMVITFDTGTDDKDDNTRLEIFLVSPAPGQPAVAYYDDGQADYIGVGTKKSFTVPPFAQGFTFQELTSETILIKITPVGDDRWRFRFSAILYFADGTEARVPETGNLVLDQDANQLFYPLTGAILLGSKKPVPSKPHSTKPASRKRAA